MNNIQIVLFLAVIGVNFAARQLPSYIKKCSVSDPHINKCILDQTKDVIHEIIKGEKEHKIPAMNPFHLAEIVIEATKTLNIKLTDCYIFGLKDAEFLKLNNDMKNLQSNFSVFIPTVTIKTTYDIDGRILILPIQGHGAAEIRLTNVTFNFQFSWKIKKEKDGKNYANIVDAHLQYKIDNAFYQLENLFNGNKQLSDEMNTFINDNSEEFSQSIQPAVSRTVTDIIYGILNTFAKTIPYNEIFDS